MKLLFSGLGVRDNDKDESKGIFKVHISTRKFKINKKIRKLRYLLISSKRIFLVKAKL